MTKAKIPSDLYVWTGPFTIAMDTPGHIAGWLDEVSPLSQAGVVQLSFDRATCPPEEYDSHIVFDLSEDTARRLLEQLTRVVHRAEAMRALYRMGALREEMLTHRDELPWQLEADSDDTDVGPT